MNENEAQQVMNFCPKGLKVFMTMCTPNPTWKNIGQLTTTLEFINIKTEIKSWINIHVIGNVVIIVLHCPRTAIKFFFFFAVHPNGARNLPWSMNRSANFILPKKSFHFSLLSKNFLQFTTILLFICHMHNKCLAYSNIYSLTFVIAN